MGFMEVMAAIAGLLKALPQITKLINSVVQLVGDEIAMAKFEEAVKRLKEASAAAQASAHPNPTNPQAPAGNTSQLETFFGSGGHK